jgi:hypothetical protein
LPDEQDVKDALAEMYLHASDAVATLYYVKLETLRAARNLSFSIEMTGTSLWNRLKVHLCKMLNEEWGVNDVVHSVLEFMATFMPGGIVIARLVKRVVKYILAQGYRNLCPASLA